MIDMTDMSLSWIIQQPKSMLVIVVGFGSRGIPSRVDDVRNDWKTWILEDDVCVERTISTGCCTPSAVAAAAAVQGRENGTEPR